MALSAFTHHQSRAPFIFLKMEISLIYPSILSMSIFEIYIFTDWYSNFDFTRYTVIFTVKYNRTRTLKFLELCRTWLQKLSKGAGILAMAIYNSMQACIIMINEGVLLGSKKTANQVTRLTLKYNDVLRYLGTTCRCIV